MLNIQEIGRAIAEGVSEANREYGLWSGGLSIHDHGIEPLMSASIGRSLFNATEEKHGPGRCYITLETSFSEILECSGASPKGRRPTILGPGSRADVTYYNQRDRPTGVIEVKRWFSYSGMKKDLKRVTALISKYGSENGGSFRWGAVAALRQRWSDESKTASEVVRSFLQKAERDFPLFQFEEYFSSVKTEPDEEEPNFLGYDAICIFVRFT